MKELKAKHKSIIVSWKKKLKLKDRKVLTHFEKFNNVGYFFIVQCHLNGLNFYNQKNLALTYAHFLKIYVALTSLRNTELDALNWEHCCELPFRLDRLARGEKPYVELPQTIVRLKKSIDFANPQRMLKLYGEVEQNIINQLAVSEVDDVANFLFSFGPSLLSFIILMKVESDYLIQESYRSRMIKIISFIVHEEKHTASFRRSKTFALIQMLESRI